MAGLADCYDFQQYKKKTIKTVSQEKKDQEARKRRAVWYMRWKEGVKEGGYQ